MIHFLWHLFHPGQSCEPEEPVTEINDVALCRQLLYDAFQEPEVVAQMVELPAISAEVAEMERRAHHERLAALAPVLPLLVGQSDFMGAAAGALQCSTPDTAENQEIVTAVFTNVIKASVIASVSTAVALGVLEINREVSLEQ